MEELDFSKIFGETATSKASFTDENYISGWGHLGSTPPPYQLFDYLQGLNDKKSKYLYDSLNENKNSLLAHNTDTSAHEDIRQKFNSYLSKIESETKLSAHNADTTAHSPILNAIKAITGTSAYDIAPSKTIAAIIPLLGYGGIVAQLLETNGYVKFANGLTFQWGDIRIYDRDTQITFPIQFSQQCFCGMVTAQKSTGYLTGSQCNPAVRLATTTGMVATMYDNTNTGWYWLAIGI